MCDPVDNDVANGGLVGYLLNVERQDLDELLVRKILFILAMFVDDASPERRCTSLDATGEIIEYLLAWLLNQPPVVGAFDHTADNDEI